MRFIDASVFVHAYLKPKKSLKPHEKRIKESAKSILSRVNEGERVLTTVVHVGEIANILEKFLPLHNALELESTILTKENIEIADVPRNLYLNAIPVASDNQLGLNDALAAVAMKEMGVSEIYSFDRDFDGLENVKRVTK